jgi:hypothetical protein
LRYRPTRRAPLRIGGVVQIDKGLKGRESLGIITVALDASLQGRHREPVDPEAWSQPSRHVDRRSLNKATRQAGTFQGTMKTDPMDTKLVGIPGGAGRERRLKWSLLILCGALASQPRAVAQEPSADGSPAPRRMTECEGAEPETCGNWVFTEREGVGQWSNGASAILTLQQFEPEHVIVRRTDTSALRPASPRSIQDGCTAIAWKAR